MRSKAALLSGSFNRLQQTVHIRHRPLTAAMHAKGLVSVLTAGLICSICAAELQHAGEHDLLAILCAPLCKSHFCLLHTR